MSEERTAGAYADLIESGKVAVSSATQKFAELSFLRLFSHLETGLLENVLRTESLLGALAQVARVNQLTALAEEAFRESSRLPVDAPPRAYHYHMGLYLREAAEQAKLDFMAKFAASQTEFTAAVGQVFRVGGDVVSKMLGQSVGAITSYVDLRRKLDEAEARGEPPSAAAAIIANEIIYVGTTSLAGVTRVMKDAVETGRLRLAGGTLQLGGGSAVHIVGRAGAAGFALWVAFSVGKTIGDALYREPWFNQAVADLIDFSVDLLTEDTPLEAYPSEHGSLAMLVNAIDGGIDIPALTALMASSSNVEDPKPGMVALFNHIAPQLMPDVPALTVGDDKGTYHRRVVEVLKSAREVYPLADLSMTDLSALGAAEIAARAARADGLAYRYALAHLSPVVLEGVPAIFDAHNANGQLNLADGLSGGMTAAYIEDRATMLAALVARNRAELDYAPGISGKTFFKDFVSLTSVMTEAAADGFLFLERDEPSPDTAHYLFGSESSEGTLSGAEANDHIYGGGGDDLAKGFAGNDYVEGGAGRDFLSGGAGNDALFGQDGDDFLDGRAGEPGGGDPDILRGGEGIDVYLAGSRDIITDTDGLGLVFFGDYALRGGTLVEGSANEYEAADRRYRYVLSGTTLAVTRDADGGQLIIEGYGPGDLGIALDDQVRVIPEMSVFPGTSEDDKGERTADLNHALLGDGLPNQVLGYEGDDDLHGLGGRDILWGGPGDDYGDGGSGDDELWGEDGHDALLGGDGDDRIGGGAGADLLSGEMGADVLEGGAEGDALFGGLGGDVLYGAEGNDIVFGEGAAGVLGRDWNLGIELRPRSVAERPAALGDAVLTAATAFDSSLDDGGDLLLHVPAAPHREGRGDHLYGEGGDDFIHGFDGNDLLVGGPGDDGLFGDWGDDRLLGGSGHDYLVGGDGADALLAGSGHDALWGNDGDDFLRGGEGHDLLHGDHPGEETQVGDDRLHGGAGDDDLYGNAGADMLSGGAGDDRLRGGRGDDHLSGGPGDDVFFFGAEDGQDVIRDRQGTNVVVFDYTVSLGDLAWGLQGGALAITNRATNARLTIEDWAHGGIDRLELQGDIVIPNRSVVNLLDLPTHDTHRDADMAREGLVEGTPGRDLMVFGKGNAVFSGGDGDDTYLLPPGYGASPTVRDTAGADTVRLIGDSGLSTVVIGRSGEDLSVTFDGGLIRLEDWPGSSVERLVLGDGTSLDREALDAYFRNRAPLGPGSLPDQVTEVGADFSIQVPTDAFTDPDGDPLHYRLRVYNSNGGLLPEPDWLGWDGEAGVITVRPEVEHQGPYQLRVTALDPLGEESTPAEFSLKVKRSPEQAPLFADPPDARARVGRAFRYELPFAPNPVVYFEADDVPDQTPIFGVLGSGGSLTQGKEPPSPLILLAAPGVWNVDTRIGFDGDIDYARLSQLPDGSAFAEGEEGAFEPLEGAPPWLRYDAEANALYGTPGAADLGEHTVRLRVRDSNLEVYDVKYAFDLTVAPEQEGPVLHQPLADITVLEDEPLDLALPVDQVVSGDGSALVFSVDRRSGEGLPDWLHFDGENHRLVGLPDDDAVGHWDLRLTARDGDGDTETGEFRLSVINVNDPPEVAQPVIDVVAVEDYPFSHYLDPGLFLDPDPGDAVTVTARSIHGGPLPRWLDFDPGQHHFSGAPENGDVGEWRLRLEAFDSNGGRATSELVVSVLNTNDAPVLLDAPEDQTATAGTPFLFRVPADTFADPDAGDSLSLEASLTGGAPLPDWLEFDASEMEFRGTPAAADDGTLRVRMTARDPEGETASGEFALTVETPAPDPGIEGTDGADLLFGTDGDDRISGGAGEDRLAGGPGDDHLLGGAGPDALQGDGGDDLLEGGSQEDALVGGLGNDTYLLPGEWGHDRIFERGGSEDVLVWPDHAPLDLVFSRIPGAVKASTVAGDSSVRMVGGPRYRGSSGIERFEAAGGAVLMEAQVDALIQAMGGFVSANEGIDTWRDAVREHPEEAASLLAAHWQVPGSA